MTYYRLGYVEIPTLILCPKPVVCLLPRMIFTDTMNTIAD